MPAAPKSSRADAAACLAPNRFMCMDLHALLIPPAYSLRPCRCKHARPGDSEVRLEPQLIRSPPVCYRPHNPLVYFLPYISGTRRAVGQFKAPCNTEDKVCRFNTAVYMHGSLAGKITYGKISPWQKSTKSESLTNFSVLPSPTLPTSRSSKVRVINVQKSSDR